MYNPKDNQQAESPTRMDTSMTTPPSSRRRQRAPVVVAAAVAVAAAAAAAAKSPATAASTNAYRTQSSYSKGYKPQKTRWQLRDRRSVALVCSAALFAATLSLGHVNSKLLRGLRRSRPSDVLSAFEAKPRMVGYRMMDVGISAVSPTSAKTSTVAAPTRIISGSATAAAAAAKNKITSKRLLLHSTNGVVRIHPVTFEIHPPTEAGSSPSPLSSSHDASSSSISKSKSASFFWNWNDREVDILGEEWVDWSDTVDFMDMDKDKDDESDDEADEEECALLHDWQKKAFPTCNAVHEQDINAQLTHPDRLNPKFLLGSGSIRDVWLLEQNTDLNARVDSTVLKTIRMKHDMDADDLDRHRRDALVSERLKGNPYVLDIYAYCGNSAVYEYASGGSLYETIGAKEYDYERLDRAGQARFRKWTPRQKFVYAWQAVSAVAALHDIDHDGLPSVAHDDLDISQFVTVNQGKTFKLSDFNGAQLIEYKKNKEGDYKVCPFHPNMKGGKIRSPEEYLGHECTEKMDIYSLGNVLYSVLTGRYPFKDMSAVRATEKIKNGLRPDVFEEYKSNDDVLIQAILDAIRQCWKQDPEDRPSAVQIKALMEPHTRAKKKTSR